jgi:threonine dehydratase
MAQDSSATHEPGAADAATVTPDDVRAAAALLAPVVRRTALVHSRVLSERVGREVFLKCENLQRAGSFKIRGAYTRMARLSAAERAAGVVAASAGNHAQGVALAGGLLGIETHVFMPAGAALPKVEATRGYGAQVTLIGHSVDDALRAAADWAAAHGAVFVHPFDHPDVVAGQGTVGLEILDQCPDVAAILVCTGGGGLLAGVATAVRGVPPGGSTGVATGRRPGVRVVGVQAEGAAAYPPSLAAGHPVSIPAIATMADGIAVGRPGQVPFELVRAHVDRVVTVSEELISRALLLLLERAKLVVEPAGAVGVAALLDDGLLDDGLLDDGLLDDGLLGAAPSANGPVVVVLSGGNLDPLLLMRVVRHGMAAAGRYLQLRLRLPDRPGSLAALLALLAAAEANVLEVEHVRAGPRMSVDEVELGLRLETQGPTHCAQVLATLRGAGYPSLLA